MHEKVKNKNKNGGANSKRGVQEAK